MAVAPKGAVQGLLDGVLKGELESIERQLLGNGDPDAHQQIPKNGMPKKIILAKAQVQIEKQGGWASGQKWGGVYHFEPGHGGSGSSVTDARQGPSLLGEKLHIGDVQQSLWAMFNSTNLLYPGVFPGPRKFEAEITSMVLGMLNGPQCGAVGLLTSGGTESILLAVLAYREQGRLKGIDKPQIICGITAHPAVFKACSYFNVELIRTSVDAKTMQMDPKEVSRRINARTVAIYASAPTFTHGVIDPVAELAALARAKGVGLHVDNCLGGFLSSYMAKEGLLKGKQFDFRVAGVTSISVDVHKYGFASKGVSVVGFRDPALRRLTYVPSMDGCEGLYVTTTLQGSRPGGVVAQAWGTMLHVGDDGYRRSARQLHGVMENVRRIVAATPPLKLLVDFDCCCVPIASTDPLVGVYQVASVLEKKGWNMFTGQNPPVMTLCIGEQHLQVLPRWAADLKAAVAHVKANPGLKIDGAAAVYGAASTAPDEVLDGLLRSYCDIRMQVKPSSK